MFSLRSVINNLLPCLKQVLDRELVSFVFQLNTQHTPDLYSSFPRTWHWVFGNPIRGIENGLWFVPVQKLTESRHGTNQSPPSSDSCEPQHTHVLAAWQVLVMAQEATTDAYSVAIPTVLHAPSGVPRTLTPPLPIPPPSIPTQEEGRGVSNRDNESWCEGG